MADEEDQIEENTEADEESEDGEGGGKKGGKKKLLMILVPILLLGGGGAGAYFTGMLDSLLGVGAEEIECAEGDEECEHQKEEAAKHAKEEGADNEKHSSKKSSGGHGEEGGEGGEDAESVFLPIPTMLVDLNSDDGMPRHLRLSVQLELEDPSDKAEVKAVIPRVIDQFQVFLREMRVRDLRGSAGIYRLQMELLWRVNQATDPIEIKDVLFQEILIQ